MAKAKKDTKKETAAATASTATSATSVYNCTISRSQGTDLTIADLKNLATIIDVASTRGAFRANEMATVGVMFNKLVSILSPKVAPCR
jgi:hypothetical protein